MGKLLKKHHLEYRTDFRSLNHQHPIREMLKWLSIQVMDGFLRTHAFHNVKNQGELASADGIAAKTIQMNYKKGQLYARSNI